MTHIFADEDGAVYKRDPSSTLRSAITLPTGVSVTSPAHRPWGFIYDGALYMGGLWNHNITYYNEPDRLRKAGITAPASAPSLAAGAAGNPVGSMIGYYSFAELDADGNVLAESSLSPASGAVSVTAQKVSWTSIAGTSSDARVTHVILYRQVDGDGLPKEVTKLTIGTTTYTDDVATATLQVEEFNWGDKDGLLDATARGLPPTARYACIFEHCAWYFTWDKTDSRAVYKSRTFEPEAVSSDPIESLVKIPSGKLPLCGVGRSNELMVFCSPNEIWSFRVLDDGLVARDRISDTDSIIAPFGALNVRGIVMWPGPEGYLAYAGGAASEIRNLMSRSNRKRWMEDLEAYPDEFHDGFAFDDGKGKFHFIVSLPESPKTLVYTANYRVMFEYGAPEPIWTRRILDRLEYTGAVLYDSGSRNGYTAWGAEDGHVRKDDPTDTTDDGDTYNKRLTLRKGAVCPDFTGDDSHGATFKELDLFLTNDTCDVVVTCWAGDLGAPDGTAQYTETIPSAQAARDGFTDRDSVHLVLDSCAGKMLHKQIDVDNPDAGFEYLGDAVTFEPFGSQQRG